MARLVIVADPAFLHVSSPCILTPASPPSRPDLSLRFYYSYQLDENKLLPLENLAALYSPDHGLHWFTFAWLPELSGF